jgi:hypothetical protein
MSADAHAQSANQVRFLGLSDTSRPLSTEDPSFDSFLPVDDTAWDDCVRLPRHFACHYCDGTDCFDRRQQSQQMLS